jgi:hypothetical protein
MSRFNKKELLDTLIEENQQFSKKVEKVFLPLSKEKLNYKPNSKSWSISEVFQHLMISEKVYLKQIIALEDNWKDSTRESYASNWFGEFFVGALAPKGQKVSKIPAPKFLDPSKIDTNANKDPHEVIISYMQKHEELIAKMELAKSKDIEDVKLNIAIPVFKIKLGDAFRALTAHALRHYIQAEKNLG